MKMFISLIFITIISFSYGQDKNVVHNYVVDNALLLTHPQMDSLDAEIHELEKSIGSQLAIVIIESLKGQKIEEYTLETANKWKLGRAKYDDGILIGVALSDRQMRIEVGFGLEKIVTDEIAAKIIREKMVPRFKEEQYFKGLLAAVREIKLLIKNNKKLIGQR
jgi:uncharacterized membrane protein YgcG